MVKNKKITILTDAVEQQFLPFIRTPSRYIGGEVNQIKKNLNTCDLKVALCFPDVYEIGMSHTGMAIVYEALNRPPNVAAERVFLPWPDAQEIMTQKNIPLYTLESKAKVADFDVLGFSLTNELCYTNVLNALDLAGIPLRSKDRDANEPLILGGAGMANCCEPVADFFDMFLLGQAEDAAVEIAKFLIERKSKNTPKQEILAEAAEKFPFLYIPSLYDSSRPKISDAVVDDLDSSIVPEKPIVPFTQAIHERISIEVMRGCPGRCNFCQASFCRRPVRFRSPQRIFEIAKKAYAATGFDTISLLSLSTADYPYLEEAVGMLKEYFEPRKVGISLPSLRVDVQLRLLPKLASTVRKSGLTIAVEAASERLRKIINKPITDENLFAAIEEAYKQGFETIKLYFMTGLPGETEEDIKNIVRLSFELAVLRKKICGRVANINVAVSWFVPKVHTPFGRLAQQSEEYFRNAKDIIFDEKRKLNARFLNFKFHHIQRSLLESAIGRGDRKLADVIEYAYKNGAKFDLWDEHFNFYVWQNAFEKFGLDLYQLAAKEFKPDEVLPWEHLGGPDKNYLLKQLQETEDKTHRR
ncbi:MAG: B12-binding domain-containing radical SAM protein [Planctomycetes bacterium HGW-Planctomycetes-1]|nr:MAG: B12-binding domain-containing radical SAM protein [Planctomycetes bacterium HGW-Planctomycetes-1]